MLALALVLIGAWFAKARIVGAWAKRAAADAGVTLIYDDLSIDGLSSASVSGLRVVRAGDVDVAIARASVEFDLWQLVGGDPAGLKRLVVGGVHGHVGPLPERPASSAPARGLTRWPTTVPEIDAQVEDFTFAWGGQRAVRVRGARFSVDARGVQVAAERAAWIDGEAIVEHPLDVLARYDAGRFDVERATWDPRIVLDRGSADLTHVDEGRFAFVARARAFDAGLAADGRVADGLLDTRVRVDGLDVGRIVAAFLPESGGDLRGRLSGGIEARVPLAWPGDASGRVRLVATDVGFASRELDRVEIEASGTLRAPAIDEALILHGANAVRVVGALDRPFVDLCALPDRITAFVEGQVDDVGAILTHDVGLRAAPPPSTSTSTDEPQVDSAPSHVDVQAVLAHGFVDGSVDGRGVDVHDVVARSGARVPLHGAADVRARVRLSLRAARDITVEGRVSTGRFEAWRRVLDALDARVVWSLGSVSLQDTWIVQGPNAIEIPFATVPTDPCALRTETRGRFHASLRDLPALMPDDPTRRPFDTLPEHRLDVAGRIAGGVAVLESGSFESGTNRLTVNAGSVPLHEDPLAVLRDPALDVGLGLDFDDLSSVARVLPIPGMRGAEADTLPSGSLTGSATLNGSVGGPRGRLDFTASDVHYRGAVVDEAAVVAELDEFELSLRRLDARSSLGTVSGTGRYVFADRRCIGVRLAADLVDLARLAPDSALPRGRVTARAELDGVWPEFDGRLDAEADGLRAAGVDVTDIALHATLERGHVRLAEARLTVGDLGARLAGDVDWIADEPANPVARAPRTVRLRLDSFEISSGARTSVATTPSTWIVGPERFEIAGLQMAGDLGFAEVDVARAGDSIRGRARLLGVEPVRWPLPWPSFVPTDTRGDVTVEGTIDASSVKLSTTGRLEARAAEDGSGPASSIDWSLALDERTVRVERLAAEWREGPGRFDGTLVGSAPFDARAALSTSDVASALVDGPLDVTLEATVDALQAFAPPEWGLEGSFLAHAHAISSWSDVRGSLEVAATNLSVPKTRAQPTLADAAVDLRVVFDDQGASLETGTLRVGTLAQAFASGRWNARLDARELARRRFDRYLDATLEGSVELQTVDLAPLSTLVPALRRTGGEIHAWLDVSGTARAPTWRGSAALTDGEIRTSSNLPSIAGVNGRVKLEGSILTLEDVAGELGGAPFRLSGTIDAFTPTPSFDTRLVGESLLLWREGDVTVRADADLALVGPLSGLTLRGKLALRDARYTKKVDFLSFARPSTASAPTQGLRLFSLEEAPFSNMKLDVAVTTATPFQITNNVVRGAVSPDLQLVGTGLAPDLRGIVLVEPSRVLLPSGSLKVRTGRVEFRPDRPGVPFLDLQANARLQGYDVDISVSGPSDNPRVDLSSVPPLPREDLVLLVITGRPPGDSLTLAGGQRAAVDVAVYIARDLAAAWLDGDNEDDIESLAERIEVVVGADRTKSGGDSVLVRMRLTRDTGDRGSGLYLTGERDVYDFYNFGVRLVVTFP